MKKGVFVVFESAPKCGKTAAATQLEERMEVVGERVLHKRGALSVSEFAENYKGLKVDDDIGYSTAFYWADTVFDTGDCIAPALAQEVTVIQERYDLSVVAYREIHGYEGDFFLLKEYRKRGMIIDPDLTVFLTAAPETVFERIKQGADSSVVDLAFVNETKKFQGMQDSIRQHLEDLGRNYITIETDMISVEETVDIVMNEMVKIGGKNLIDDTTARIGGI